MTMLYCIREVGPDDLVISGFEDHDIPDKQYRIFKGHCTCPARSDSCKHVQMVERFREAGIPFEGVFYDPDADYFYDVVPLDEPVRIPPKEAENI